MVTHSWQTVGEKEAARVMVILGLGWPAANEEPAEGAGMEERSSSGAAFEEAVGEPGRNWRRWF